MRFTVAHDVADKDVDDVLPVLLSIRHLACLARVFVKIDDRRTGAALLDVAQGFV